MSLQTRTRMTRAERREQLLDVTRDIAHRAGFHALSIEAVAREAGITRPVVYDHFASLDGLLVALVERETARALEQLNTLLPAAREADAPGDVLLASLRAYLEAVAADPVTWRLVTLAPEGLPAVLKDRIAESREGIAAGLAAIAGAGLAPDRPSPDPELTAHAMQALGEEAARLLLTDPAAYPVERLMAHARWLVAQLSG